MWCNIVCGAYSCCFSYFVVTVVKKINFDEMAYTKPFHQNYSFCIYMQTSDNTKLYCKKSVFNKRIAVHIGQIKLLHVDETASTEAVSTEYKNLIKLCYF